MQNALGKMLFVASLLCLTGAAARAADLTGAWADNTAVCDKVFVKKGNTISFAEDADMHCSGFIIENGRVRGKMATCTIKSRKQDGDVVHVIAACSTDVALQTVQFSFKTDGENEITRMFPGVPELQMQYSRCRL